MAEEGGGGRRRRDKQLVVDAEDGSAAPVPAAYILHVQMENLVDKLKLLGYTSHFCQRYKLRPLSHCYFALPGNAAEQLHYFACLMSWLVNLAGHNFPAPEPYDDPNEITSNILHELRRQGMATDFPQTRLRQGHGEEVCLILNTLAQQALKAVEWKWQRPVHKAETAQDEEDEEMAAMVTTATKADPDDIEDNLNEDDEDDAFFTVDAYQPPGALSSGSVAGAVAQDAGILKSGFDATEWRLEVERVLPQLKVHIRTDHKDWRAHTEQMRTHLSEITGSMTDTEKNLAKLQMDIGKTLEKIDSREKYLNKQLDHLMQEYRLQQDSLAGTTERYKQASVSVTDLSRQLARVTEQLEVIKAQMDERGTSMTDAGPLVKIKQALTRLRADVQEMELRIGVVQHTLLTAKLKNKNTVVHSMNTHSEFPEQYAV